MPRQRLRVEIDYDMNNHKSDISILGTLGSRIELNDIWFQFLDLRKVKLWSLPIENSSVRPLMRSKNN